jgi:hypothetical protein
MNANNTQVLGEISLFIVSILVIAVSLGQLT